MRRAARALLYRRCTMCFACGKLAKKPCPGHEYGGVIGAQQRRPAARWVPWWIVRLVG